MLSSVQLNVGSVIGRYSHFRDLLALEIYLCLLFVNVQQSWRLATLVLPVVIMSKAINALDAIYLYMCSVAQLWGRKAPVRRSGALSAVLANNQHQRPHELEKGWPNPPHNRHSNQLPDQLHLGHLLRPTHPNPESPTLIVFFPNPAGELPESVMDRRRPISSARPGSWWTPTPNPSSRRIVGLT